MWPCGHRVPPATVLSLKHHNNLSTQRPLATPGGAGALGLRPPLTLRFVGQMLFFLKLQLALKSLFPVLVGCINRAKSRQIPAAHHLK